MVWIRGDVKVFLYCPTRGSFVRYSLSYEIFSLYFKDINRASWLFVFPLFMYGRYLFPLDYFCSKHPTCSGQKKKKKEQKTKNEKQKTKEHQSSIISRDLEILGEIVDKGSSCLTS